jgi:hypothetical protein
MLETIREYATLRLALFRSSEDPWGAEFALNSLGRLAEAEGRYAADRSLYGESIALFRQITDTWRRGTTAPFWDLIFPNELVGQEEMGRAALHQGAYEDAKTLIEERMKQRREIGNQTGMVLSLIGFAALSLAHSLPKPFPEQDEVRFQHAGRGSALLAAAGALAKARGFRQGLGLFFISSELRFPSGLGI